MISVIVPVYNVERFLPKCIDSLLKQTYTKLEILLVDDGSTDSSGAVCDAYAQKDGRIRVLHKTNGGLSDARNAGLHAAAGELIGFVDGDDYIEPDMFEKMAEAMEKYQSELCCCGRMREIQERGERWKQEPECYVKEDIRYERETALKLFLQRKRLDASVCNKLFSAGLLNDEQFPVGKLYEDMEFTYRILKKCKTVTHIKGCKYHYVIRTGSITQKITGRKELDCIEAAFHIYQDVLQSSSDLKYAAGFYYAGYLDDILKRLSCGRKVLERGEYRELYRNYRHFFIFLLADPHRGIRVKTGSLLLLFGVYHFLKRRGL